MKPKLCSHCVRAPRRLARWIPVALLYAPSTVAGADEPSKAVFGLSLCEQHRVDLTLADVLTPERRRMLAVKFRMDGRPAPDFDRTVLDWAPVEQGRTSA